MLAMNDGTHKTINPQDIIDQLYDIALDPETLDGFIDAWNHAGLDARAARQTIQDIDQFDHAYRAHLNRADTFLSRGASQDEAPDLADTLRPFNALAAFIVGHNLQVLASNAGAQQAFSIEDGARLEGSNLPVEALEAISRALRAVPSNRDHLLKVTVADQRGPALFQLRRLDSGNAEGPGHVLVVTTRYHWQAALDQTLLEVFALTAAERGVVRGLVEGLDAKAIAVARGTSEGTVRGQIKSILAKMNARTQSEVIRLVMSLRDVSRGASVISEAPSTHPPATTCDWLQAEVWKPFNTLVLPDGRRLDYHVMGPIDGAPVLYSHMGYCLARWHEPMLRLAFQLGLRVICPIRAGYGQSSNLSPKSDVIQATRDDTRYLLDHLKISRLPYVTQGNDRILATDFAGHHPDMISEIIGICARPCVPGDRHYSGMGKWHRFFLSTAKHAPHLLRFTAKAAVTMAKRIGVDEMFRQMHQSSAADRALVKRGHLYDVLVANAQLIAGKDTNVAEAYTKEILATEADWSELMVRCKDTKMWFINGAQDPAMDVAMIAEYREAYPWIEIDVLPDAGQLLIYQQFQTVIPKIADAAKRARAASKVVLPSDL